MTTSGTFKFSISRDDIVRDSMLNIGKLGEGESPTPSELNDCTRKLNMLVKQYMGNTDFAPGIKVWTRRRGHLFLSSTTNQYLAGPNAVGWTTTYNKFSTTAAVAGGASIVFLNAVTGIVVGDNFGLQMIDGSLFWSKVNSIDTVGKSVTLNASVTSSGSSIGAVAFDYTTTAQNPEAVESAVLRDMDSNDVPVNIMTSQEYDFLPSKTNTTFVSDPTAIYHEWQLSNSYIYTDMAAAQDVTKHLVITYLEPIQDFNNPLDTPEYPQQYYLLLCWGLSKQIAPMFGVPWTQDMQNNYLEAAAVARQKDPERSALFYQPGIE